MTKQHLTRASGELFRRAPDERFPSLAALAVHCRPEKDESADAWVSPSMLVPEATPDGRFALRANTDGPLGLNDWSFGQLCGLARVSKDTVNRLSPDTAALVFRETRPGGSKPLQLLSRGESIRSVHGTAYTRLHNADLVDVVREYATDFTPPQAGFNGATGLYCGSRTCSAS